MPHTPSTDLIPDVRRLGRWAVGGPIELWRYATRSVPVHRSERDAVGGEDILDTSELDPVLADEIQVAADGVGPAFHRTYSARISGANGDARNVLRALTRDFGGATPGGITEVEHPDGASSLEVGDEVRIHLAGPWDAPVRVIATSATHFRFATINGHMESGEIEFRAKDGSDPGDVTFTIESWARSATRRFAALYHPLGMAKEVQLHMWTTVIERVAERSGGSIQDGIRVVTIRGDHPA